uniref:Mariner transposase [Bombyx mori] n=1 Tax=Lepeophtheirus salmonis TaxID=72036 RepID=A0A0K2VEM4_LEPSM
MVVVPDNIDAVRELIMQDLLVTYCEREVSLDIFLAPAYIRYCMIIGCKKGLFSLDPVQFENRSKEGSSRLVQGNVEKIRWRCFKRRL